MRSYRLSRPFDISLESYGGSQMWFPQKYQLQTGCGPVALANLYAWYRNLRLNQSDMTRLQELITRFLSGPVVLPQQFIRGARRLFERSGFHLDPIRQTLFRHSPKGRERVLRLIISSLETDHPLPLLMGPNRPGAVYRRDFKNHWVLITGLDLEAERAVLHVSSWGSPFEVDLDQLIQSKLFISVLSLRVSRQ
ncbi:hypothetical protein [Proteiniclasticum sp. QWL-01]|uniref:hypothetical protein n=1 Tax=Proteiniclasticum sp. QWL-01 TaxID=3036945 RepID=UPI00241186B8|nr:hypothetical protein [Proteiniclasticum sp. QWL-01]WFF73862.1 hypothetical protein P6M73_05290 [Proteiniclasticum sp. QWL-01]